MTPTPTIPVVFHLPPVRSWVLAGLLLGLGAGVQAQQANRPAVAPAQAEVSADDIVRAALLGLRNIDAGEPATIWLAAPEFVRQSVKQVDFVVTVHQQRERLGTVNSRNWVSVDRMALSLAANQPPLMCANVVFATRAQRSANAQERVSLCHSGGQWHLTGYTSALPGGQSAPTTGSAPARPR